MDGLELLRQDHDRVRTLFTSFREAADAEDGTQMAELVGEIFHELEVHTAIEEEVFYPMIHDAGGQDLTEHTDESYEEHHVVDVLMEEIRGLSADDPSFKAKMTVLMENVEHHASGGRGRDVPAGTGAVLSGSARTARRGAAGGQDPSRDGGHHQGRSARAGA